MFHPRFFGPISIGLYLMVVGWGLVVTADQPIQVRMISHLAILPEASVVVSVFSVVTALLTYLFFDQYVAKTWQVSTAFRSLYRIGFGLQLLVTLVPVNLVQDIQTIIHFLLSIGFFAPMGAMMPMIRVPWPGGRARYALGLFWGSGVLSLIGVLVSWNIVLFQLSALSVFWYWMYCLTWAKQTEQT